MNRLPRAVSPDDPRLHVWDFLLCRENYQQQLEPFDYPSEGTAPQLKYLHNVFVIHPDVIHIICILNYLNPTRKENGKLIFALRQ